MKHAFSNRFLPLLAAGLGGICLLLRLALYGLEESTGLLPEAHPLHIATVIISIAAVLGTVFCVRPLKGSPKYRLNFPSSKSAAFGSCFAGLFLVPTGFDILGQAAGMLDWFRAALAFACVPCLMTAGWCRFKGRRPHFLLHGTVCLFFATHMMCLYRVWSGKPQIEDYLFPLFACVFLSLTAYHRTAFDARMGKRRSLLLCGLLAGFFCVCSLTGDGNRTFYLAGALWSLTCLCRIQLPPKTEEVQPDVPAPDAPET